MKTDILKLAESVQVEHERAEKRSRLLEWLITGNTNNFLAPIMGKVPGGGWRD